MHDKVVRRRRAVLALLVALSLFLLTAYFGESAGGGLHATQRGAPGGPRSDPAGPTRRSSPPATCSGGSATRSTPRTSATGCSASAISSAARSRSCRSPTASSSSSRACRRSTPRAACSSTTRCTARVYQRSPSTWYQTVTINKGSSDGVAVDDPVVNGQGLQGKVKSVSGNAVVMLLTDQDFGVSALAPRRGEPGSITRSRAPAATCCSTSSTTRRRSARATSS